MLSIKKTVLVTLSTLLLGVISVNSMAANHVPIHHFHPVHINHHPKHHYARVNHTFRTHKLHGHGKVRASLNHSHIRKVGHTYLSHQIRVRHS